MTASTTGGVEVLDEGGPVLPGSTLTAHVGQEHAGQWVSAWLHSDPVWLGWQLVSESGRVQVVLPDDAAAGAHKLVVKDAAGGLIGWAEVSLEEDSGGADPVATRVTTAKARAAFGKPVRLTVSVDPSATGSVSVELPGTAEPVTAQLVDGSAAVRIPAGVLAPGAWRLPVSYAGVPDQFEPSTGVASVRVVKADPRVMAKPLKRRVERGRAAVFRIAVSGVGVDPSGDVLVRIGRRVKRVELNSNGRAIVRIKLAPRAKPGRRKVVVTYTGDAYAAREKVIRIIRITR